jgi:hypothetical protein
MIPALYDALDGYSELLRRHQIAMRLAAKTEKFLRDQVKRQQNQITTARAWLKPGWRTAKKGKATA